MKNTKKNIDITKLHPFENHPYKVQDKGNVQSAYGTHTQVCTQR